MLTALTFAASFFLQAQAAEILLAQSKVPARSPDCEAFLQTLPTDYFHGWIKVPENHAKPGEKQIHVHVYGRWAPSMRNPIAFFNGGPGSPNFAFSLFEKRMREKRDEYSFLYISQRGTGCSDKFPEGADSETLQRLRHYGSSAIVRDAELVRRNLLGEKKWKIFGSSYGALIVHRYVAVAPESVEKAYAHGNAISADPKQRLRERINAQGRIVHDYLVNFPTDKPLLKFMRGYAATNKCLDFRDESGSARKTCGFATTDLILSGLLIPSVWGKVNWMLAELITGNSLDMEALTDFAKVLYAASRGINAAPGAVLAYYDRDVLSYNEESCKNALEGIEEPLYHECQGPMQRHLTDTLTPKIQETLGGERDLLTLAAVRAGLEKMAPASFFLYSGEADSFVPKETFAAEVQALGGLVRYKNFPQSGHEGYRMEDQLWSDLLL